MERAGMQWEAGRNNDGMKEKKRFGILRSRACFQLLGRPARDEKKEDLKGKEKRERHY